jgi:O-antigen/teichoic acid export membrane protein
MVYGAERLGRAFWGLLDQAASSLGSALVGVLAARSLSAASYGIFAFFLTSFTVLIGITRAYSSQILAIDHPHGSKLQPLALRQSAGVVYLIGLGVCILSLVSTLVLSDMWGSAATAFAFAVVGLLAQDYVRTTLVSQGLARAAFLNDVICSVVQVGLIFVSAKFNLISGPVDVIIGWGLGAWAGAVAGIAQLKAVPTLALSSLRAWRRKIGRRSDTLAVEWLCIVGSSQATMLLIPILLGSAVLGGLRGAFTLLGPMNAVGLAITAFAIPEVARNAISRRAVIRSAVLISTALLVLDLGWGLVALSLPASAGTYLLGDSWEGARAVLLFATLQLGAVALTVGPTNVLQAKGQVRASLLVAIVNGVLALALGLTGTAVLRSPNGTLGGMMLASILVAPYAWKVLSAKATEESS